MSSPAEIESARQASDSEATDLKNMNREELRDWLADKGIPERFCKAFEDGYVDGEVFITLSESEVREIVPPIGLAKKIMLLIPTTKTADKASSNKPGTSSQSETPSLSRSFSSPPPRSPPFQDDGSSIHSYSSSIGRSGAGLVIPDNWRVETQDAIDEKSLDSETRGDIARTLVTLMTAKHGSIQSSHIQDTARKLILKYPFMADDIGSGYTSWVERMKECWRNREKAAKRKGKRSASGTSPKRQRKMTPKDMLLRRYPARVQDITEDSTSIEHLKKMLADELKKSKSRESVLLPLMRSTFQERRMLIQNEASTVAEILENYPALARPAIVKQEMEFIVGPKDIHATFEKNWTSVVPAVLKYASKSKKKHTVSILSSLKESDDTSKQVTALKVLVECMTHGRGKTEIGELCYIYEEYQITETPESVVSAPPLRNTPRIAAFIGEETTQYFILVEQMTLCQVPSLQLAIFIMFSSYYIFHLEYPRPVQNIFFFLQDFILSFPDSFKRPGTYLSVAADIRKHID